MCYLRSSIFNIILGFSYCYGFLRKKLWIIILIFSLGIFLETAYAHQLDKTLKKMKVLKNADTECCTCELFSYENCLTRNLFVQSSFLIFDGDILGHTKDKIGFSKFKYRIVSSPYIFCEGISYEQDLTALNLINAKRIASGCACSGMGCICAFDSCGSSGAELCGCNGVDCDCVSLRCPKYSTTSNCSGFVDCNSDGQRHCNRHGCP